MVAGIAAFRGVIFVAQVFVHFGIECGLDGELAPLLGEGAEILLGLDAFGQICGHGSEFLLSHWLTHEGIILNVLLIRGR